MTASPAIIALPSTYRATATQPASAATGSAAYISVAAVFRPSAAHIFQFINHQITHLILHNSSWNNFQMRF